MPFSQPARILAVDDVVSNLLTLRVCLSDGGFTLREVTSSAEALASLAEESFDLILLDVLLPGMNGFELAARIKAEPRWSAIPIIFLTAHSTEELITRGFEVGGVDFLAKPFLKSELVSRIRTHLALKEKNEALEVVARELNEAKMGRDHFFSLLAHDLRNPLSGFLSLLDSLRSHANQLSPKELEEALATMESSARNMNRLLDTLLDWGRSQTGVLSFDVQPYPVSFLIAEALEPLEQSFQVKQITVTTQVIPAGVLVDRYSAVTIVRNLLSNALKYTRSGGTVRVSTRLEHQGVSVCVSDNGVGISPVTLAGLFHLENKTSTPGTDAEPGTGLGLILCREFAEKNGGSLVVESQLGHGTQFTLRLKLADCPNDVAEVS